MSADAPTPATWRGRWRSPSAAAARTSPNPMVGAVIVDDEGVVVGRGSHAVAGGPHAEVIALAEAGARARGATLYCTLEPCSHTGAPGPARRRSCAAGIRRAVLAMEDPEPAGQWTRHRHSPRAAAWTSTSACSKPRRRRLNAPFLTRMRRGRAAVTMKVALSADGRVALAGGRPIRLTGAVADRRIHRDRAEVDAIAHRVRHAARGRSAADRARRLPPPAARCASILDRRLRTPTRRACSRRSSHGPVIIVTRAAERPRRLAAPAGPAGARSRSFRRRAAVRAGGAAAAGGAGTTSVCSKAGRPSPRVLGPAAGRSRPDVRRPRTIGPDGLAWWSTAGAVAALLDDRVSSALGADLLIEGDVHRVD